MTDPIRKLSRRPHLAPHVVFVDGLSGSGKSALSMILSSLKRVEVHRIDPVYEQTCALRYLEQITEDGARAFIRTQTDITCYDVMLARGSNFRPDDISSVLLQKDIYTERLTLPDGDKVLGRIQQESPILHLMIHQSMAIATPLFKALEGRITFLEMVRHPLFLLTAWYGYIDRYGTDPLEFDLCFDYQGHDLPWFAAGWEDIYLQSNKMDRIIQSIKRLFDLRFEVLENLSPSMRERVLIIPFSKFVTKPWPFIEKIESLLQTQRTPFTDIVLKGQNMPREFINDVPDHDAYRKYGWNPVEGVHSAEEDLERQLELAQKEASPAVFAILEKFCTDYERIYLKE